MGSHNYTSHIMSSFMFLFFRTALGVEACSNILGVTCVESVARVTRV
jgi:hypothetical protein